MVVRYFVIGPNGERYGPADVETLSQWVSEGRVQSSQMLEIEQFGTRFIASDIPELNFPIVNQGQFADGHPPQPGVPPPYQGYPRQNQPSGVNGANDVSQAWVYGIISFICCPLIGIRGIMLALQAQKKGHPGARAALIFNAVAMGIGSFFHIARPLLTHLLHLRFR